MGVNSREGRGSTFWFNLEMEFDPAAVEDSASPQLRGRRLLVVDDHALARNVLIRQPNAGDASAGAADGAAALDLLRKAAAAGEPFEMAEWMPACPEWTMPLVCALSAIPSWRKLAWS